MRTNVGRIGFGILCALATCGQAQGVLPPTLTRKAVMEEFIPAHQRPGKAD